MALNPWFLHADLDAFFASVEQLDHPEYRGKPLIVGGLPTDPRSVVSTASYEARKYGVHSAMPTAKAYKLCPHGIYVHGNMKRYEELSYKIMQIFKRYSPDVMQMSIDEAFIDLTGTERLFGPPEQTAMEIKRVVKEETGLTVSIGLASSKYFAKVSSGLSKPDGFYFMKPGTETEFMLHKPIEKIWGIGGKTAKRIFDSGIKTTKQLYEKPLDVLVFMYGESTGTFLYNILRGNAEGMFDGDAKSHSISNERTFPIDITDVYTNETALLELAHSVMFRLLRENLSAKTIVIKIRYEDFTTVSIRQTYAHDILTLDSFYEKVKDLFEKKYEKGRGVRLLGVGFDNVKTERSTYQQELFDDGEKKKQAVEQAILKIEKKFPDIRVQKARLVKPDAKSGKKNIGADQTDTKFGAGISSVKSKLILAAFLILGILAKSPKIWADDETKSDGAGTLLVDTPFLAPLPGESPETLFIKKINDADVEFIASGYWNAEFTGSAIMAFNGGEPFSISLGVPVFKQEVNLSAWLMIDKKWYFEASFADQFNKNTLALGYKGEGIVKSALISNRNIVYPSYYSSNYFGYNPGGGENQSPGFGIHLEKEKMFADFMVRYDMQKMRDATFFGYNSVTDTEIRLNDYISGRFFVIPSGFVTKIKSVYVENNSGNYIDENGRKYKKLSSSQYFILPAKSTLILSEDAQSGKTENTIPTVLVTFTSMGDTDSLVKSIGSYSDKNSFLGKIQEYFNSAQNKSEDIISGINLEDYAYGKTSDSLKAKIENETALVIQSPLGFSPFLNASNYDLGFESEADVFIYSKSNEKPNADYLIENTRDSLLFSEADFFNEKHSYGTVFTKSDSENAENKQDFENDVSLRFPLADTNPMIYLNNSYESDLGILLRMYSAVSSIQIDSGVSAGCVQVYKNGVLDAGAKYDSVTGIITLSSSISETDKIYVTWAEETDDILNGKVSGGIGFGYQFTPTLRGDIDLTVSWPISPFTKYADSNDVQNGYATLTTGVRYEKENFSVSDAVSFGVESNNVTGSVIVLESSADIPETFYLSSTDGYQTQGLPVLNTGFSEPKLEKENKTSPGNLAGTTDANISGHKIPIEADFSKIPDSEAAWTSADIKLSSGELLLNGDTFNIALKQENIPSDYDVYLQLGNYATTNEIKISEDLLPTWKISEKSSAVIKPLSLDAGTTGNWQIVSVKLSEGDRARFSAYHDARIIVVAKKGTARGKSGFIYAGPYETETAAFETFSSKGISVKSSSSIDNFSPSSSKFSKTYNYVSKVEWKTETSAANPSSQNADSTVRFGSFFKKSDYSRYKTIRFDYKLNLKNADSAKAAAKQNEIGQNSPPAKQTEFGENSFAFILENGASSILESGIPSVKAVVNGGYLAENESNGWHSFEIDISQKAIYIDGSKVPSEYCTIFINSAVVPSVMKIELNGFDSGEFYFDTLYFDGISPDLKAQNYFATAYKKEGAMLSVNETPVLSDFSVNLNSKQIVSAIPNSGENPSGIIQGFLGSGVTVSTVRLDVDTSLSSSNKKIIDNAGHSVSTVAPILKLISVTENYRFSPNENTAEKKDSATIDISNFFVPLALTGNANVKDSNISKSQGFSGDVSFSSKYVLFSANANFNQKINTIKEAESHAKLENYFLSYADSTLSQFSGGEENAGNRAQTMGAALTGIIPFAELSPKISYLICGEYNSLSETSYNDDQTLSFEIPFKIGKNSINLGWKKSGEKIASIAKGGNYKTDVERTFSDLGGMDWFFTSIIFNDLFAKDLSSKILQDNLDSHSQALGYATNYSVNWNRNLFNSMKDFFIPISAGFEVERNIKATELISDFHQYKFTVGNSFINLFGADSKKKLFKWYNQDEFTSSLEYAIKVPYEDNPNITYALSVYSQLVFYISDAKNLKTAADFAIETTGDWSARGTLIFSYPGQKAPILSLVKLFLKDDKKINEKISRKGIFNMELNSTSQDFFQKYELAHSCEVNFLKNFSLSGMIKTGYTHYKVASDTLALELTIGGRMEF